MLYSRRSWVALGVWLRYGVLRGRPHKTPTELLADYGEPWHEGVHAGRAGHALRRLCRRALRALRDAVRPPRRRPARRAAPGALRLVRRITATR